MTKPNLQYTCCISIIETPCNGKNSCNCVNLRSCRESLEHTLNMAKNIENILRYCTVKAKLLQIMAKIRCNILSNITNCFARFQKMSNLSFAIFQKILNIPFRRKGWTFTEIVQREHILKWDLNIQQPGQLLSS